MLIKMCVFIFGLFKKKELTKETYIWYSANVELQIVCFDNSVLLFDVLVSGMSKEALHKLVQQKIMESYRNGVLNGVDKSNKYYTSISTRNIKKVLFKIDSIKEEIKEC